MLGAYTDMLILMGTLVLWNFARRFATTIEIATMEKLTGKSLEVSGAQCLWSHGIGTWEHIREQYRYLTEFTTEINGLLGTNVTLFLLEFIFDYSVTLDDNRIFTNPNPDWKTLLFCVFYLVNGMVIFYFAADIVTQVISKNFIYICKMFIYLLDTN